MIEQLKNLVVKSSGRPMLDYIHVSISSYVPYRCK